MLVDIVPIDLDELLQDSSLTTSALDCEACRVVEMAVYLTAVLVIRVLGTKDCGTDGAGEVLDMELHVECSDVATTQSRTAFCAYQAQATEVIRLAQWVLPPAGPIDREEFGSYDFAAVLSHGKSGQINVVIRYDQGRRNSSLPDNGSSLDGRLYLTLGRIVRSLPDRILRIFVIASIAILQNAEAGFCCDWHRCDYLMKNLWNDRFPDCRYVLQAEVVSPASLSMRRQHRSVSPQHQKSCDHC